MLSPAEWSAVRLTAELAGLTTVLLLLVGTPMAWWLARTRSPAKPVWPRWWPCRWCCRPR
jgi:molybdate transport system permease protein